MGGNCKLTKRQYFLFVVLELNFWAHDNLANCASIDDDTCSRHSSVNSDASTVILEDSHIENMQSAKDCFSLAVRRNPGDGELRALAEFAANNSGIINRINKHAREDARKLANLEGKIRRLQIREQVLKTREEVLNSRQHDLDNENARLKQVEEKYMADQARRSEEIEVCRDDVAEWQNNAHYTMRVLESKVKNRDEVIKDLKARYEASLEVNRLKAELNSCRDSADDGEDKKPLAKKPKK